jgi:hypothetical protein
MARRTPPEEDIPLIVYKPFVWGSALPAKPPAGPPGNVPSMTAAEHTPPTFDLRNEAYDGYLIGRNGDERPWTPLSQVPGVLPLGGHPTQKIIYINGILNSPKEHYESLEAIANTANAEVVGVYNASEGFWKDFAQCVKDKLGIGHNPAVETLKNTLYAELTSGSQQPINLMAHSQGALITSRALGDVRNQLKEDGLSPKEIDARMSRINVDTFGGAAWHYPDGPHYNHNTNVLDPVSNLFGQNTLPIATAVVAPVLTPLAVATATGAVHNPGGGAGSHQHSFVGVALNPHAFTDVYLKHWQSQFPRDAPHP